MTGNRLAGLTGAVFLFRIMVGVVAPLELSAIWTGSRHTTETTPDAQRRARRSLTEFETPGSNTNGEPTGWP